MGVRCPKVQHEACGDPAHPISTDESEPFHCQRHFCVECHRTPVVYACIYCPLSWCGKHRLRVIDAPAASVHHLHASTKAADVPAGVAQIICAACVSALHTAVERGMPLEEGAWQRPVVHAVSSSGSSSGALSSLLLSSSSAIASAAEEEAAVVAGPVKRTSSAPRDDRARVRRRTAATAAAPPPAPPPLAHPSAVLSDGAAAACSVSVATSTGVSSSFASILATLTVPLSDASAASAAASAASPAAVATAQNTPTTTDVDVVTRAAAAAVSIVPISNPSAVVTHAPESLRLRGDTVSVVTDLSASAAAARAATLSVPTHSDATATAVALGSSSSSSSSIPVFISDDALHRLLARGDLPPGLVSKLKATSPEK